MMSKSKGLSVFSLIIFTVLGLGSLGLKCGVEGTRPGNLAPLVKFSNIPQDGTTFTSQPTVNWFGKDLDGYVDKYQYIVFKASQIDSLGPILGYGLGVYPNNAVNDTFIAFLNSIAGTKWLDTLIEVGDQLQALGEKEVVPVELTTNQGAGQTSAKVQLFASTDPQEVILQFLFLRAVDNLGLTSSIIFRTFSRTNNPPNSSIDFNNKEVYYSLSDSTRTWFGIDMSWGGKDSIDYPLGEPPLEFFWELFYLGPDASDTLNPDTTNLIGVSFDPEDGDKWVKEKGGKLPLGLQTGYHMFRVRARDDAFIEDASPARSIFYVISPTFPKDVLLVDITTFFNNFTGVVTNPDFYRPYYVQMLASAGYPTDSVWASEDKEQSPDERLLSQYQVVIVINHDPKSGINDSLGRQLEKYLNVGGKIWVVGNYTFTTDAVFSIGDRDTLSFDGQLRAALGGGEAGYGTDIGGIYGGLESIFIPGWGDEPDYKCSGGKCDSNWQTWGPFPEDRNEEFVGASPLVGGWPMLEIDTVNVKLASSYRNDLQIILKDKLPHVCASVVASIHPNFPDLPPAQALYLFVSAYGPTPVTMQGKPVITRYQGTTFKGSVCTFPLYFIKFNQSVELTNQMMSWFLFDVSS